MKKTLSLILIVLLIIGALAGCAEPGNAPAFVTPVNAGDTLPAESNQTTELSAAIEFAYFPLPAAGEEQQVSSEALAAYEKLIAYRNRDYGQQSIADFNAVLAPTPDELTEFLAAVADVGSSISPEDENYGFFTTTMTFSAHELYCEHMGEEFNLFVGHATMWTSMGKPYMILPVLSRRMPPTP